MVENELTITDRENIWHPFSPLTGSQPIIIDKAKGAFLYTIDERKILDGISSWWVNIHGHAQPKVAKAISEQAKKLEQVIFAGFTHKPAIKLSLKLKMLLPEDQDKIFFSDDGSTSTEVALKIAIQYWHNQGIKRKKIIAISGAYHGDTFGAMSIGDRGIFNLPFFDYLFDVQFIPFPEGSGNHSLERMRELVDEEVAAFIFEPLVQGASGMRMYKPEILDQLIDLAKEKDIICIADEVMTGFGRTGKNFACDYLRNNPDIFCISKGLTAGFLPMGITSVNKRITSVFNNDNFNNTFFHGHSYTANPLACAAANASIKLLNKRKCQDSIKMIAEAHQEFISKLNEFECISDARCFGTIMAIELKTDMPGYGSHLKETIYNYFLDRDILLRPLGNVIYLIPPYVITKSELEFVYTHIIEFLSDQ